MKARNLYLLADVLLAMAGASAAFGLVNKKMSLTLPLGLLAASSVTAFVQAAIGKTRVTNRSNCDVYYKDESSTGVNVLRKGESAENVDGFKVNGRIYKLCDGVHATIGEDGIVTVNSFAYGNFAQAYRGGGWRSADSLPDDWDNLKLV